MTTTTTSTKPHHNYIMADSTPATPSTPSAEDAAKSRREARKAKILGAGSDRLAKITRTGRGAEAETLYPSTPPPAPKPHTPSSPSAVTGPLIEDDDPVELPPPPPAGEFDFASIMARLQQHQQQTGGAEGSGGLPIDINQLLALTGMQPPPGSADGAQQPGVHPQAQPPAPRTKLDKTFDLLRALTMIAFAFLAVSSLFSRPSASSSISPTAVTTDDHQAHLLQRWASLAYRKPAEWEAQFFQMESFGITSSTVPIFWLFISVEIALQSSRILLFSHRPPPPSILTTALSILPLPPALSSLIRTGASYLTLLSALLNDLAIVIFGVGLTILWAQYKSGMTPEVAATMGGAWDATSQGQAGAAISQATGQVGEVLKTLSQSAASVYETASSVVSSAAIAASQRAEEL
ncbi:hypothetical protein OC845_003479 [Tilletia horrida]|nr:hypothetical protein OC845_003479 [Tilletia horrida]